MATADPTVLYDVTEPVRAAIEEPLILPVPDLVVDSMAHGAAVAALHEIADILRERASDHYRPLGQHKIADALEVEADRLAPERRL